jgi:formylglycine-generating enzyme required for sulfatase activity
MCSDAEKPSHKVQITTAFWIGQTEVTVKAWRKFAEAKDRGMPPEIQYSRRNWNPDWTIYDQPITMVSDLDAEDFCHWAGGRLPTEAEWEYAARAGNTSQQPVEQGAWFEGNSATQAHEIAQKKPNAWGLYDMLGNAEEWVADWYQEDYYSHSEATDPSGPADGNNKSDPNDTNRRVVRGGSWESPAQRLRFSARSGQPSGLRAPEFGFRCVVTGQLPY